MGQDSFRVLIFLFPSSTCLWNHPIDLPLDNSLGVFDRLWSSLFVLKRYQVISHYYGYRRFEKNLSFVKPLWFMHDNPLTTFQSVSQYLWPPGLSKGLTRGDTDWEWGASWSSLIGAGSWMLLGLLSASFTEQISKRKMLWWGRQCSWAQVFNHSASPCLHESSLTPQR